MTTPGVDCHTHAGTVDNVRKLAGICDALGYARANIVCQSIGPIVNENPAGFAAKLLYPGRFYMFGGLDHTRARTSGRVPGPPFADQIERLIAAGADGLKMIEGKPTAYESLGIPLDGLYFDEVFAALEQTGLPVLWHVADPEEFWHAEQTPEWARKRGWGYSEGTISWETLLSQVSNVLERHPALTVIFAHFLFLSANLPRASVLMSRYPNVHFDMALGVEMLFNLSRDRDASRQFFVEHSDRILYGTDMFPWLSHKEAGHRSGLVARFLESDDTFSIPHGADYLLGPPDEGVIHGLALPPDALKRIFHANFERIAGAEPKPLNRSLAAEECRRIESQVQAMGQGQAESSEAARVLDLLES